MRFQKVSPRCWHIFPESQFDLVILGTRVWKLPTKEYLLDFVIQPVTIAWLLPCRINEARHSELTKFQDWVLKALIFAATGNWPFFGLGGNFHRCRLPAGGHHFVGIDLYPQFSWCKFSTLTASSPAIWSFPRLHVFTMVLHNSTSYVWHVPCLDGLSCNFQYNSDLLFIF